MRIGIFLGAASASDSSKNFKLTHYPPAPHRTHHLHIYSDRAELERHVAFRDRLRSDPSARQAYEALKRRLAVQHRDDREAYTEGKSAFIETVVSRTLTRGQVL
jgi:GrpB-like predicted nucleotidyltransferase (UPF0157 family)